MATITTDTYLDDAARTAGEAWTITNAKLTIRTDTRWHAGSPASMTGSLGSLNCNSTVGGVIIDGTKVRWLPYTGGSGTVPAIGTTITQGGVSGYFLGVWFSIQGAPYAIGGAFAATGFIKLREVTGGTFTAGALSGISATASGPDTPGWIEVVMDQSSVITLAPKGDSLKIIGDWFQIGVTTGVTGQQFKVPANGTSAGNQIGGVQIETSPGSGVYEWYGTCSGTYFSASYTTRDARGKLLYSNSDGTLTLSSSTNVSYLPPAGCKVRIPNVILRSCTTANRANNAFLSPITLQPTFATGKLSNISISNAAGNWYFNLILFRDISITNSCFEGGMALGHTVGSVVISNISISNPSDLGVHAFTANLVNTSFTFTNNVITRGLNYYTGSFTKCSNITFENNKCTVQYVQGTQAVINFSQCNNITLNNYKTIGGGVLFANCLNVESDNHDYCFNCGATTQSNNNTYAITATNTSKLIYQHLTYGFNGTINNQHPNMGIFSTTGCVDVKFRNIGTSNTPISAGSNTKTQYCWVPLAATKDNGLKFSRIFISSTLTSIAQTSGAGLFAIDSDELINIGDYGVPLLVLGLENAIIKGVRSSVVGSSWVDAAGTHCADNFTSATAGSVVCNLGNPSTTSLSNFTTSIDGSNIYSGFDNVSVKLVTAGDSCIYEMPYSILGHTAFQNVDPTFAVTTNLANHTYEYQVDTGSGYSGTWKTMTGANLSSETISATGFRIKFRFVCVTPDNTNAIGKFTILTTSTASAQANNLYPLDNAQLSFTGLIPGSEVRVYSGTDPATATEVGGTEATGGSTFSLSHSVAGTDGTIVILAMGYQPIYLPYTFKATDDSILIQPVVDRNYVNPV